MNCQTENDLAIELAHARTTFLDRAKQLGYDDLSLYFWYHTIELGDELVTPGSYDYRSALESFGFPVNMSGMKVLDVGAATGFFSFEFEQRGAAVIATELPSIDVLDCFPGESVINTMRKLENAFRAHSVFNPSETNTLFHTIPRERFYYYFLDAPFDFCARMKHSQVKRKYTSIYDISPETMGDSFDLVFLGEVLLHTINPLQALASAASVCKEKLIISQPISDGNDELPIMYYVGGTEIGERLSWWLPNKGSLEQILHKLGFSKVEAIGEHHDLVRPHGNTTRSIVIHAER